MTLRWILPQGGEISAPETVEPGGTITITVTGDVDVVTVGIAGQGAREVQVTDGEAQFTLPPSADPGTVVIVSDNKLPRPSSTTVRVVGGN